MIRRRLRPGPTTEDGPEITTFYRLVMATNRSAKAPLLQVLFTSETAMHRWEREFPELANCLIKSNKGKRSQFGRYYRDEKDLSH